MTPEELRDLRLTRLASFARQGKTSDRAPSFRNLPAPNMHGIEDRTNFDVMPWKTFSRDDYVDAPRPNTRPKETLQSSLGYTVHTKYKKKVQAETDLLSGYWGWHGIIEPEYDLLEPYTILDTESYFATAVTRKHSLMFRNGFTVAGNNQNFVTYIERRFAQMGYVSGQSVENFLKDILWNLLICSNCILVKVRDSAASGGVKNEKNGNKMPIAGYVVVPPQTVFPYLDGYGQVIKWRRFFGDGRPFKDYDIDDIVHFWWNRKPGHLFGTPRIWPVRDDIYALRRLEENVELLLIQHLFPLLHTKIGTPEAPCEYLPDGISEVDMYRAYIQSMPKEGVLVTDERVSIDCVGVGNQGAQYEGVLEHYKKRTFTGMGVSSVDMGETDATKSGADNVSQNLKDQIKADLAWFTQQFKLLVLKDLFSEAPFHLSIQNAVNDVSLEFHELDPDNQIKMETHAANSYNNQAITHPELRRALKRKPLLPEEERDLHFNKHTMVENEFHAKHEEKMAKIAAAAKPAAGKKTGAKKKPAKTAPAKKSAAPRKVSKTMTQPSNQYGTNHDPHKAKTSREDLEHMLFDFLSEAAVLITEDLPWDVVSGIAIDRVFSVLNQHGAQADAKRLDRVKQFVAGSSDPELLYSAIQAALADPVQDDEPGE
jgi:hypothetical protein